jgi:CheY-like chemotaxis protein
LEKIGSSANHLLGLINDILDMSRIESGHVTVKNDEFSMQELLDQISIIIQGQCHDKRLNYKCNIADNVKDYYIGDDLKLKQIIINILGNSVKFTNPKGDVKLTVEQLSEENGICKMRFTMQDTGIGMDPEYVPKIFETFSMEDVSNTTRYGGSGLGMAITKNLVEIMNGEIHVESKKGVGSTFVVILPLTASDRDRAKETESESSDGNIEPVLSGKRVLIAEDVDQNAEILADLLDTEDIRSARARNGEDAVRMFSKSEKGFYSAILMDVRMPVMDGLDATKAIRALDHPDAKTIPIIAMTANVFDEDVERSMKAGMNEHLSKPVEPDKLFDTMARLIKQRAEEGVNKNEDE